jgi:hypothetical protein
VRDPRFDIHPNDWSTIKTELGFWYRFKTRPQARRIPLTEEEAEELRRYGWEVEDPRRPERPSERLATDRRLAHLTARTERIAAREHAFAESLRLAEKERNEHLWFPRLCTKIPHNLSPDAWYRVQADYDAEWCLTNGVRCHRHELTCTWDLPYGVEKPEDGAPDLDYLRAIVFGWADGTNATELERAVDFYRTKGRGVVNLLQPILVPRFPGQVLLKRLAYLDRIRGQVEAALEQWPDSPLALSRFDESLCSEFDLDELQAPVTGARVLFGLSEEAEQLRQYRRRWEHFETLRSTVQTRLITSGWTLREGELVEARPNRKGPKPSYLNRVTRGLYAYLAPIYCRTFRDSRGNPEPLRRHISRLLGPFFPATSCERGEPLWEAINTFSYPS